MWPPDPAVIIRVSPIAVCIQIFSSPDVLVVILNVVSETLGQVALTIVDPLVNYIERCVGCEVPVAGVVTRHDQFSGSSVSK
jgi:hypothetical protein